MPNQKRIFTQQQIRGIRDQHFGFHAQDNDYPVHRLLEDYDNHLPEFNGKKVSQIISDKVSRSMDQINILDIGCGQGLFFASLLDNPRIKAYGLSAFDFRSGLEPWKTLNSKIDYRVGDAQRLNRVFSDVDFDVIVTLLALEYTADPLAVIKQAYKRSKEGGIIFIDKFYPPLTRIQANLLQSYWEKHNIRSYFKRWVSEGDKYEPSLHSIALQRGENQRLPLPFAYSLPQGRYEIKPDSLDGNSYGAHFQYAFNEEAVVKALNS